MVTDRSALLILNPFSSLNICLSSDLKLGVVRLSHGHVYLWSGRTEQIYTNHEVEYGNKGDRRLSRTGGTKTEI